MAVKGFYAQLEYRPGESTELCLYKNKQLANRETPERWNCMLSIKLTNEQLTEFLHQGVTVVKID